MSTYGTDIINRYPEHHSIHETGNLLRIMIDESIGEYLDEQLTQLESNCDARFLDTAQGLFLDKFGERYGVPRKGLTDSEYRNKLISTRTGDITLKTIRGVLSKLLDLEQSEVIITNSNTGICRLNNMTLQDMSSEYQPCTLGSYYETGNGVISISVPPGTDTSSVEDLLYLMILPGVLVNWIIRSA